MVQIKLLIASFALQFARLARAGLCNATDVGQTVQVTAVVVDLPANRSAFQCWEFPVSASPVGNIRGVPQIDLFNITAARYNVFPGGFKSNLVRSPAIQ